MRKDLLLRGADELEANAANPMGVQFDLSVWGHAFTSDGLRTPITADCGTRACAMGLFVIKKTFKDEGLTNWPSSAIGEIVPAILADGDLSYHATGFDAASLLFDISCVDAVYLFSAGRYEGVTKGAVAELEVARRIRKLVADAPDEATDEQSGDICGAPTASNGDDDAPIES